MFRAFWLASLVSNLGTWVHEIGASWLMTTLDAAPEMVASVRTAMALPVVFLAIPAGALADRIDRRRLLIVTQWALFAITALLAVLTLFGGINSWLLLALTFALGLGMVVHVPTWQASIPELVPKSNLRRAVALGSVSFNLARSAGPAMGGLLIAAAGIWSAFAFNAVSFASLIVVLLVWRRQRQESVPEISFWRTLGDGVRYVVQIRVMRNVIVGVLLFVIPGSALWSLLPLVARERLGWDETGFGMLVASIGVGGRCWPRAHYPPLNDAGD